MLMRGVAVVLGYLFGVAATISIGIVGLMALQSSIKPTPSAPVAATVAQKERLTRPVKQTTVAQKDARTNQKRKATHVARKRKEEAPTMAPSGFSAYGYAPEPRRHYQYPFQFFGR
jgi:hypothetical protein